MAERDWDLADAVAARLAPAAIDAFGLLGYSPTPRQELFHEAPEWEVLYGGAAGGGKTRALIMHGIRACCDHPGLSAWAFRRTYPELQDSFLQELADLGYAKALAPAWGGTEPRWFESKTELRFPNGSVLKFRYCEDVPDTSRYQSAQMQLLLIDESSLLIPEVIERLSVRVRSGRSWVPVLGIRLGSNPGGLGHMWHRERFIEAGPPNRRMHACSECGAVLDEDATDAEPCPLCGEKFEFQTRRFIPAKIADNPHLDSGYAKRLSGLPAATRAAFRDGSWDVFEGQFFTEFNRDDHVIPPFPVPRNWTRFQAIDYGYGAPYCALWFAVGPDKELYVYRERYGTGRTPSMQVAEMLGAERDERGHPVETLDYRVADPSIWSKTGIGDAVSAQYHLAGMTGLRPAMNARVDGWARVREMLRIDPVTGRPRLMIFDNCVNLIRTLPMLIRDPKKPEDLNTDGEDHAADALRYGVMSRARVTSAPRAHEPATLEERLAAREKAKRKATRFHPILGR